MTAISMTTPALGSTPFTGSLRSTRLRLTLRGRRVLAVVAALPAVIAIAVAMISGGTALASRDAGAPAGSFETVTVMHGDSLWSIAEEVAPLADPRDVVDAIVRLNRERGYTFCVIEHDMDFIARLCDSVIVMAEGRVLTRGAPADILRNEQVIEAYLGTGLKNRVLAAGPGEAMLGAAAP